ncbi:MAG TPA: hypothetical protein VIT43_13415 [Candidatus Dormibacteraeota bacterium]
MKRTFLAIVSLATLAVAALPVSVLADTIATDMAAPVPAGSGQGGPGGGGPGPGGGPGGGGGMFPPAPPYVSASCHGPNNDGTVYASQEDTCTLIASGILHSSNRLIVIPNGPMGGESIRGCGASSGLTMATENFERQGFDPVSCSFTVLSGVTVFPGEVVGSERFTIDAFTSPGAIVRLAVNGCSDGPGSACGGTVEVTAGGPGGVVSSDPPFSVSMIRATASEGQPFSGAVARISDADPTASSSEYVADISWGDATPQVQASLDGWNISGSHIYLEEGTYFVTVTVTDRDLDHTISVSDWSVTVADAPLHPSGTSSASNGTSIASTNPLTATLASFSDDDPNGTVADYTATVNWGDGMTSAGNVQPGATGFDVLGGHSYAALGPYTVMVHVCDVGGACMDTRANVLVFAPTSGGNFVIGDGNTTAGSSVTFWDAQWATSNSLSGGAAPADFKGFADSPNGLPSCGDTWSTTPGNSAHPPDTVPSYTAMIMTSAVTSDSARISGTVGKIVIVKTDPGYASDPGHIGTGTIVAVLC